MFAVYVLIDPIDNLVRYVGIAENVYTRFIQHINCQGSNADKNLWIMDRRSKNLMIIMRTIDQAETRAEALILEQKWIAYYSKAGMPLFNRQIAVKFTELRKRAEKKAGSTTMTRYRFSEKEEDMFITAYAASGSIDKALRAMNKGTNYRAHAREIIQALGLRQA